MNCTLEERARRAGLASAASRAKKKIEDAKKMFTEHDLMDPAKNDREFADNCRKFIALKLAAAALLFFAVSAHATIMPGQPDRLVWGASTSAGVRYVVYVGTASNALTVTYTTALGVTSFTLTNLAFGVWFANVRAVTVTGVQSDPTPTITWTNAPDPPGDLKIQGTTNGVAEIWLSLPFGADVVQSSDDTTNWADYFLVSNITADPVKAVGLRVSETQPARIYRARSSVPTLRRRAKFPPIP